MKTILLIFSIMQCTNLSAQWKVDFSDPQELQLWYRVNDTVMGGLSQSNLRLVDEIAYFEGELSLENNGGFASVRRVGPLALDGGNKPLVVKVNGDGRNYQLRLRTNKVFDGVAYVVSFTSKRNEWQTLTFTENDFVAQFRGGKVKQAPALLFTDVKQLGFMIADKQPGAFQLAINKIGQ